MGRTPKDFDVATSATPDQVINLFGKRRTVPVGVSFGVVMVLGPSKDCGQVEVATFRSDGEYLDGRRPDSVQFCSPEEDAQRRDFTINGMFFDPMTEQLLDYVGGQKDLQRKIIRAIGDPSARFQEDKLRMLRAVRFSATFDFPLEEATAAAVRHQKDQLLQVSVERIAAEFRRMMSHPSRSIAIKLLVKTELYEILFSHSDTPRDSDQVCNLIGKLHKPAFEPAFAFLFQDVFRNQYDHARQRCKKVKDTCKQWKLSNTETESICWILDSAHQCETPGSIPLHIMKPILADDRHPLLIDFLNASATETTGQRSATAAEQLQSYRKGASSELLNPPPFVTGKDLFDLGAKAGPQFAKLIADVRRLQLDEVIISHEAALEWVKRQLEDDDSV